MLTRYALTNRLTTAALLLLLTAEVLWGCGSRPLGSGSLAQNGLSLAVWLEDQCESRERDERSVTMLEAFHDGLIVPTEMLFAVGVVTVVSTAWSLFDRITLPAGEPLPNRPEMVMAYIRPHRAGPTFDSKHHEHDVPIAWHGCLG